MPIDNRIQCSIAVTYIVQSEYGGWQGTEETNTKGYFLPEKTIRSQYSTLIHKTYTQVVIIDIYNDNDFIKCFFRSRVFIILSDIVE